MYTHTSRVNRIIAASPGDVSLDLRDELNLDGHVARQRVGAHGRARVDASLAEDGTQQLGAAVEDLGLLRELGRAVDEADHLDDPLHLVEVAWSRQMELPQPRPARSLALPWHLGGACATAASPSQGHCSHAGLPSSCLSVASSSRAMILAISAPSSVE